MDFSKWTRQDFQAFHAREQEVMQPTEEELDAQRKISEERTIEVVKGKLLVYGIEFTGKEKDLSGLYEAYIKGDGTENNKPMNERLGGDDRLEEVLNEKKTRSNDLKSFCNFVLNYES